jgi:hypothetical protein
MTRSTLAALAATIRSKLQLPRALLQIGWAMPLARAAVPAE